jgi:hypothetical protein
MTTKLIKITIGGSDGFYYINPVFITSIRNLKVSDPEQKGHRSVIYTMDGNSIYANETPDEIVKMINRSEMFTIEKKEV